MKNLARYFIIALLLVITFFALLQSKWAREKVQETLTSYLKEAHIDVELSPIDGRLPFSWHLNHAHLKFPNQESLALKNVTMRLAIFPLLKGKFTLDYIHVEKASYTLSEIPSTEALSLDMAREKAHAFIHKLDIPMAISLTHVGIDELSIKDTKSDKTFEIGLLASVKWRPIKREFAFHGQIFSPKTKTCYADLTLNGSHPLNTIESSLYLNLPDLSGTLSLKGTWNSWEEILSGKEAKDPLAGTLEGSTSWQNTRWTGSSMFGLKDIFSVQIEQLLVKSDELKLKAKGTLTKDLKSSHIAFTATASDMSTLYPRFSQGQLKSKGVYTSGTFRMDVEGKDLIIDGIHTEDLTAHCHGTLSQDAIAAQVDLATSSKLFPIKAHVGLCYSSESLDIQEFEITSLQDSLKGKICYDNHLLRGELHLSATDLSRLEPFIEEHLLYGAVNLDLFLTPLENTQEVAATIDGSFLRYDNLLIDKLSLKADINNPLRSPTGTLKATLENVFTPTLYLDRLFVESETMQDFLSSFRLDMQGRTDAPFALNCTGAWKKTEETTKVTLATTSGYYRDMPIILNSPTTFTKDLTTCSLTPLDLTVGRGYIQGSLHALPSSIEASLNASHVPLALLRPFSPHIRFEGLASAVGSLQITPKSLQGNLNATLETAELTSADSDKPMHTKGTFQLYLQEKRAQIFLNLKASHGQFLDWTASLPTQYSLDPFTFSLDKNAPITSELTAEGDLSELFNFINLGTNHFGGHLATRLFLSQTLSSPSLLGEISWSEGSYENDFTGIMLQGIDATFDAKKDIIEISHLSGRDEKGGRFSANGKVYLKPKNNTFYEIDANLNELHAIHFDMIDATVSGPLHLSGNFQEMFAKSDLTLNKSTVDIAESLPYEIPHIPFTYIHKPIGTEGATLKKRAPFLFHMDIKATSDDTVIAEGRGLKATLGGAMHLKGANTNVTASGELNLVKGEYLFSGKVFKLTDGEILFNDKGSPFAYLNVSGTLNLSDAIITVQMQGPMRSPKLTFHSNPHKSTSAILALILFNKDISNINQMEAVQLASTLISLSGGAGPDILDSIRKTIGVDRLNISSRPGADGSDEIAVQIGKYLTKGVMITLSQTASSSQVIVEVELPKGFIFQAETQEEQEGKFNLKWRSSY